MSAPLNEKQEAFAQALAKGEKQIHAYETAGYAPSTSAPSALAKNPKIVERVREIILQSAANHQHIEHLATSRAVERTAVDKFWVLTRLKENVERAMTIVAVTDAEGQPTGEYRYEGAVANRALELLGKELGMFIDRKHLDVSVQQRIAMMTDEQRLEEAGKLADRIRARLDRDRHLIDVTPDEEDRGDPGEDEPS